MKTTLKLLSLHPPKDKRSDRDHHFVRNFFHIGFAANVLFVFYEKSLSQKKKKKFVSTFLVIRTDLVPLPFLPI
jgi:hypothetical protein